MDILEKARELVEGPRQERYGSPEVNHRRTADLWNAYLNGIGRAALLPEDICWLNILQKIARDMEEPNEDTLVDVVGYVLNIEKLRA